MGSTQVDSVSTAISSADKELGLALLYVMNIDDHDTLDLIGEKGGVTSVFEKLGQPFVP